MIASASLWAPATTAQISIGLATLSRVARACRAVSPRAIRTTMALAAMKGSTEETCSQNTMSCMFSPPSRLAPHWTAVMIGPYTLGVSYQGCSTHFITGSNWLRITSPIVTSYGSRPMTYNRP